MLNQAATAARHITPPTVLQERPVGEILARFPLDGEGTVTGQAYRLLRTLIVNLRLMPNQLLVENEIAACLDVSKTPVREACIRLSEERLVHTVPQKGTFVAPIELRRVFEGYFIRKSLESACVDQLSREIPPEGLRTLAAIVAEQKRLLTDRNVDPAGNAFYVQDNAFHAAIFDCAGLPGARRLVEIAKAEVDRVKSLKSLYRFCRNERQLQREHAAIFEAIAARDGERAKREIVNHFSGMNDAIRIIAGDERLWRFINRVNEISPQSRRTGKQWEESTCPRAGAALSNHA